MGQAYSFVNVQATLNAPGGSIQLGYGAATAKEGIEIKPTGDKNKMTTGADGTVMHALLADKSGKIMVRLLKTSPSNSLLMAMYDYQTTLGSTVWGQGTIVVTMNGVGDIHTGRQVAFTKRPTVKYDAEGDIMEWEFDVGQLDAVLGTY